MAFAMRELEAYAETVESYEQKNSLGITPYACAAAHMLTTGEDNPNFSSTLHLKLGVIPKFISGAHPIELAAVYMGDASLREHFLKALRDAIDLDTSGGDHIDFGNSWEAKTQMQIPPPTSPSWRIGIDVGTGWWFFPQHAAWYSTEVLRQGIADRVVYTDGAGVFIRDVGETLRASYRDPGPALDELRGAATKAVLKTLERKPAIFTSYWMEIGMAIPYCNEEEIEAVLLKKGGVTQILCLALSNPSEQAMVAGLKALARSVHLPILRLLRRGPTMEEISKSNIKGSASVWRHLPWIYLQPLLVEHLAELQTEMFKRTEVPFASVREHFIDHQRRATPLVEGSVRRQTNLERFKSYAKGLQRFYTAKEIRAALTKALPQKVAWLVMFSRFSGNTKYDDHFAPHVGKDLKALLASYTSPISVEAFSYGTEVE